jgi:Flp pilus assembly protein TadB
VIARPVQATDGNHVDSVLTFALVVLPALVLGGVALVWLGFELLLAVIFTVALAALALTLVSWW